MDALGSLTESDFKGSEDNVTAQDVAGGVGGKEADLRRETLTRLSQLNLKTEEVDVARARKGIYGYPVRAIENFDTN